MRTVVTFESRQSTRRSSDYFINPENFGDDVAKWLMGRIRQAGSQTGEKPGQEDFGWYFEFRVPEGEHCVVVGFRPGDPAPAGCWIAWLERSRSLLGSLFGGGQRGIAVSAVSAVHRALQAADVHNVRWHEEKDFDAMREERGTPAAISVATVKGTSLRESDPPPSSCGTIVRMRRRLGCLAFVLVASVGPTYGQNAQPTDGQRPEQPAGVRFLMRKPPSLRFGEAVRIDFRLKVHTDHRSFSPDLRREDPFDLRRLRAGVEGRVLEIIEYEIDYDFREDDYPLRDAFVDVRLVRPVQVRAGKFKLPFSREELTGAMNLDFAFRSRAADQLSPGRAIGAMVHGRVLKRRVQYQVGMFREDGENGRRPPAGPVSADPEPASDDAPDSRRTFTPMWAARTTISGGGDGLLKDVEVGAAITTGEIPEGRQGLRGRMVFGGGFFPAVEVNGRRQRMGLELALGIGPATVKGEYMRVRDERLGQGIENEDLGPTIARGWYVAGTWLAAGMKPGGSDRQRASRFGAVELTGRYEGLGFRGPTVGDEPSRSPRAAVIVPNTEYVSTVGANWYVNQFIRVQANAIRERLENAVRAPIPDQQVYWSAILRFQFVL